MRRNPQFVKPSGRSVALWLCILLVLAFTGTSAFAQGSSGATLQASKTIDVCDNGDGTWKFSGEVSVWNTGTATAQGLNITDCLQYKSASQSGQPKNVVCLANVQNDAPSGPTTTIPGLTSETEALRFSYDFTGFFSTPLDVNGTIRNSAQLTITNHSGGVVNGPNPKATWMGGTPPACTRSCGCTLTQGYWGTHNNNVCTSNPSSPLCVIWPSPYDPNALFFNSGLTWQQIMDTSDAGGNAYINLAHQYIAAVLNVANGACDPDSVAQLITLAQGFFNGFAAGSDFCASGGPPGTTTCGLQVTWAGILADYNQGTGAFTNNPGHCSQ
jgi:hypothetical protein